jgi:hypothetical protein
VTPPPGHRHSPGSSVLAQVSRRRQAKPAHGRAVLTLQARRTWPEGHGLGRQSRDAFPPSQPVDSPQPISLQARPPGCSNGARIPGRPELGSHRSRGGDRSFHAGHLEWRPPQTQAGQAGSVAAGLQIAVLFRLHHPQREQPANTRNRGVGPAVHWRIPGVRSLHLGTARGAKISFRAGSGQLTPRRNRLTTLGLDVDGTGPPVLPAETGSARTDRA